MMSEMRRVVRLLVISIAVVVSVCVAGADEEMSFEKRHKDKDCIYLADDLAITVNDDWSYVTRIHAQVRIQKEDAKSFGELPLTYESGREKVVSFNAWTITPDGRKLRYCSMQDFKKYDEFPMYSDQMVKVVTFPEVNVGSILEYEATVRSSGMAIQDAYWYSVGFTFNNPTKEANIAITVPKKLNIAYKEFNVAEKPVISETASTITYAWKLREVEPADDDEEFSPLPTPENFPAVAEFSSIRSWDDVRRWYYALVQKNLVIDSAIEETAGKVMAGHKKVRDKVRAVLEYLQDNFRYVSMSFGNNTLEPHPTTEVFANKYGDCKDLSLLCMAMLKAGGITSKIALYNTESSIADPKYNLPYPTVFNHVVVLVEDKEEGDYYIDPLLKGYDIGQYPLSMQGGYAFIIGENGGRFGRFPISGEKWDYESTKRRVFMHSDGSVVVEATNVWGLEFSINLRERIAGMDDREKDRLFQTIDVGVVSDGEMVERRIDGLTSRYGPVEAYAVFRSRNVFPVIGDMIIIDISGYERMSSFSQKERRQPIFNRRNSVEEEVTTYHIPNGFEVYYCPGNIVLDTGFFNITREYTKEPGVVTVKETTHMKRSEYPKEDYMKFKKFFDELPGKTEQKILLRKVRSWRDWLAETLVMVRRSPLF